MQNKFINKKTKNIIILEQTINTHGLDIVIYYEENISKYKKRRFSKDLYQFLTEFELISDNI